MGDGTISATGTGQATAVPAGEKIDELTASSALAEYQAIRTGNGTETEKIAQVKSLLQRIQKQLPKTLQSSGLEAAQELGKIAITIIEMEEIKGGLTTSSPTNERKSQVLTDEAPDRALSALEQRKSTAVSEKRDYASEAKTLLAAIRQVNALIDKIYETKPTLHTKGEHKDLTQKVVELERRKDSLILSLAAILDKPGVRELLQQKVREIEQGLKKLISQPEQG